MDKMVWQRGQQRLFAHSTHFGKCISSTKPEPRRFTQSPRDAERHQHRQRGCQMRIVGRFAPHTGHGSEKHQRRQYDGCGRPGHQPFHQWHLGTPHTGKAARLEIALRQIKPHSVMHLMPNNNLRAHDQRIAAFNNGIMQRPFPRIAVQHSVMFAQNFSRINDVVAGQPSGLTRRQWRQGGAIFAQECGPIDTALRGGVVHGAAYRTDLIPLFVQRIKQGARPSFGDCLLYTSPSPRD